MWGASARELIRRYTKRGEIELVAGLIDETLSGVVSKLDKRDLAFLDANHTLDATLRYCDVMQSKFHSGSIVVVDDIYWSEDMHRAWDILRERSEVHVDIDIFGMGILIFNSELPRQSYKVAF